MPSRFLRPFFLALSVMAVMAPAAHAGTQQISIMQDDNQLIYRDDATATKALQQMKKLGVDAVRVTVLWKNVADGAKPTAAEIAKLHGAKKTAAKKQKARFKDTNPATYPTRNWDRYDNLVKTATSLGIKVYFNITGPGPRWAMTTAPKSEARNQGTWMPKAGLYKRFVEAVGRRFDGTYRDENEGRLKLPRVSFWSLWNEPNQAGWLSPQWYHGIPASPYLYRELYQVAYKGLVATGHGQDTILLGETAPLGSTAKNSRSPIYPKTFLRELVCVDANGVPYTGAAATARHCSDFAKRGPLLATGYAHHPYTKNVAPNVPDKNPDSITMANIGDLGTLLDQLSATTGDIPSGLPLLMTEFGFETNPPDPFNGVSLDQQAQWDQLGEFMAWQNPRILSQAQFLLRDVPPVKGKPKTSKAYWFTYQSGLLYANGQPKPSSLGYTFPFIAFPGGTDPATGLPLAGFWGQAKFLPNGAQASVNIQWRPQDQSADWATVTPAIPVDGLGFFTAQAVAPSAVPGEWRAVVLDPTTGNVVIFSLTSIAA